MAESWIGEFKLSNGKTLLSDPTKWEFIFSQGNNPGDWGERPSDSELNQEISNAKWY